ncbi:MULTISPECIES: dienelactone hydrolase family protein [Paenibacillus]|uniref:dienelactone hydrolase family protein n=1 Tax=Paenibacillus TaxID=44249 RepID=UPI0022B8E85F|nr:dienelactone hydrolase family protein [Paenibacillus caseinilyticus]MCZ8518594.1 dienelactone hydrolase family protein [Paenibacillus caseinilyticus]
MGIVTEWIKYGDREQWQGYAARPAVSQGLPAVIVIQEIWGVDEHIQEVTRRLAQAGYAAFAPDLFTADGGKPEALSFERVEAAKQFLNTVPPNVWRSPEERQSALSKLPEDEQEKLTASLELIFSAGTRIPQFTEQVAAAADFLREAYPPTKGQGVASVGFCLGGLLSGTLAARDPQLRGAVIFYGNPPQKELIPSIGAPLLGFYGELDPRITEAVSAFAEELEREGKPFEYHIYPQAPHAFFNDTRPTYHVDSARDAFARTLTFLGDVLR